jgi:hypothetical protein
MLCAAFARRALIFCLVWTSVHFAHATGLTWPTNQFLPTFSAPAPVLDCIDLSSASSAEQDLFVSLEGIVNRTQPRIACVSSSVDEGKLTWLNSDHLSYLITNGYQVLQKYQTNVTGLVVTDTNQPDTLNLATTLAGLNNELICDPSLLVTLTNAPYSLSIKDDLRGRFSTKYQVYNYLYTNCWPSCTHRIIAGMETNLHGALRDYLVAAKSAVVWLDPGTSADASALQPFISSMTPVNGLYLGWWPNEGNGLQWIGQYGIPVVASDFYFNGTVYGGLNTPVSIPPIPPAPPLQNKIYVSVTMSDGDNVQYMQRHMRVNWGDSARGSVPIGWTTQPLSVVMDPTMLNYYWSTATTNDCLLAGPSGAGYTHMEAWSSANVTTFTKASNPYLQRSGIRAITVWDTLSGSAADSFAANCPTLIGLNDQDDDYYTATDNGLPVIGFPGDNSYTSSEALLYKGITNDTAGWNGTAPMFMSVQGSGWDISPTDCVTLKNSLDPAKYVFVRPDHLFLLYRQAAGLGTAAATPYVAAQPAGTSVNVGTNVTFNVIASGTGPLSYQWRLNGTNLLGATNTFFSKANVQPADGGNYTVLVTNVAGSAVSSNATLAVVVLTTNAPYVTTLAPGPVTPAGAVLNGAAVANGTNTTVWFEWGTSAGYGSQTPAVNIGNGFQLAPASAAISSLAAGAIYHFRCDASNRLGVVRGWDRIFSTGGSVQAWGDDSLQQTNVPAGLTNAVATACGTYDSVALKNDGTVAAWGYNNDYQTNVPSNVTNAVAVAAGGYHSLALRADGTVAAWGLNSSGQVGGATNLNNVIAIAAGGYHSLAIKNDGTVTAWGDNNLGQTNVPAGLANAVAVSAGVYHSLALCANGTVAAWGENTYGQTNIPAGLSNVVAISSGAYHCLALKSDGTVAAWGQNTYGQTNIPPNLTNVLAIASGYSFNLALQANGTVVSWGEDNDHQIDLPAGLTNVVQLVGGLNHGVAIGNIAPQAIGEIASGYVNHDLTIALSGVPGDGGALNYRISTLPGAGVLYQYANGARGNAINLSNPNVADSGGRVIFAPETNALGSPYDSFGFVANDGLNDSLPATVTVNIALPAPPQFLQPGSSGGSSWAFGLAFQGSTNASYSIWASTNLLTWSWLGAALETPPGYYQFSDASATNWPLRFYRVTAP